MANNSFGHRQLKRERMGRSAAFEWHVCCVMDRRGKVYIARNYFHLALLTAAGLVAGSGIARLVKR